MNYFKTFMLIFILTAIFILVGAAVGGTTGAIIALIIASCLNLFAFWNSDSIVLKMYNAKIADTKEYKAFYEITEKLVDNAHLPMPKLYVMENNIPNAFATGRNPENSAVAITTGIWDLLSKEELEGVIAHELAHIRNRDTLISTIVAILASSISMLANILIFSNIFRGSSDNSKSSGILGLIIAMFAPIVALIVQMAVSRSREYAADKLGARICHNPLALARALSKLDAYAKGMHHKQPEPTSKEASTAHMFIINPFSSNSRDNIFSTHPATENRISQLIALAKGMNIDINLTTLENIDNINNNKEFQIENGANISEKPIDYDVPNNPWR